MQAQETPVPPSGFGGIVPVMLTPFSDDDTIDFESLEKLVAWYLENGADTLFAVCLSSEMQTLDLSERVALARHSIAAVGGRVPVIVSGHISDDLDDQREELTAMADTGADALVLVTSHIDPGHEGGAVFRTNLDRIVGWLPADLPLGLYECPVPDRRLLSDDELRYCCETGRFVVLKDVSCDLATVRRRVAIAEGTPLAVVNANGAIARDAMRSGSRGFSGVFNNVHPDLYAWLYAHADEERDLVVELARFLALSAMAEPMGYPELAKVLHVRRGTIRSRHTRVIDYDIFERHWALDVLLDHIEAGGERFRELIRSEQADATGIAGT